MLRVVLLVWAFGTLLVLSACTSVRPDAEFKRLTEQFIEQYFQLNPTTATWAGVHRYDDRLPDVSEIGREWRRSVFLEYRDKLEALDPEQLQEANRIDYQMLRDRIDAELFDLDELREWQWNPLRYNIGGSLFDLIRRDFAPWEERLTSVLGRLRRIPAYYEGVKAALTNPPRVHTETAIEQTRGNIDFIRGSLATAASHASDTLRAQMALASDSAVAALEDYAGWLEGEAKKRSARDFRLGDELYRKKLRLTLQVDLDSDEIVRRAQAEFQRVRGEMAELATSLYPTYYGDSPVPGDTSLLVSRVLERIADDHPEPDSLLVEIQRVYDDIVGFVRSRALVALPDEPLVVDWEPEFSRGVAVAHLNAPGPLEQGARSFYFVSPIPADWSHSQAESFLREYNDEMIKVLTIHEAVPGHYLQLWYARRQASVIRNLFSNGPFVEGWAVYAEKMMIEAGYQQGDPRLKLQRLKFYLRAVINAILDARIHRADMTQEEALGLMTRGGFQEEAEAEGKWRRAQLTSTQLSTYFVGFQVFNDLREDYVQLLGPRFSQRTFNDKVLSYGSLPVKYLREILLPQESAGD